MPSHNASAIGFPASSPSVMVLVRHFKTISRSKWNARSLVDACAWARGVPATSNKLSSFSLYNEIDWSGNKSSFISIRHSDKTGSNCGDQLVNRVRLQCLVCYASCVILVERVVVVVVAAHAYSYLLRHASTRGDSSSSMCMREASKERKQRKYRMPLIRWLIHDFMINTLFRSIRMNFSLFIFLSFSQCRF